MSAPDLDPATVQQLRAALISKLGLTLVASVSFDVFTPYVNQQIVKDATGALVTGAAVDQSGDY